MPKFNFRLRCLLLLVLLAAALGLAAGRLQHFRQAQFIFLLRHLVEQRNLAVSRVLGNTLWELSGATLEPPGDSRLEYAIKLYPGLIDQIRTLHPEVKHDFRDALVSLMGTELSYMSSVLRFRQARNSVVALAEKSCEVNDPSTQYDIFSTEQTSPREVFRLRPRQVRDEEPTVTPQELESVKLKLADADANLRDRITVLISSYSELFASNHIPISLQVLDTADDLSDLKNGEDWAKDPKTNCIKKVQLNLSAIDRSVVHSRSEYSRLPCICLDNGH